MLSKLNINKASIQAIREELYLGKGYVVIRQTIPPETIHHLQVFWKKHHLFSYRLHFNKYKDIYLNSPDISLRNERQSVHYNFFWNQPRDEVTANIAWQIQALRNQVEGQPIDWGYLPNYYTPGESKSLRYVSSYRIVSTRQGVPVPMHSDWDLDHSKVQCSLMLSSFGEDYTDGGMLISDHFRNGHPVNISEKEGLKAGDLLLFRYAHTHGVAPVQTPPHGHGFVRMLMPIEVVDLREKSLAFRWKKHCLAFFIEAKSKIKRSKPDLTKLLTKKKRLVRGQGEALYYNGQIAQLMAIAVREGLSPAHVFLHRGLWGRFELFQEWQLKILKKHELQPHHHVLDIGCGILRLGMPLIEFLDADHYCGVDAVKEYVDLGKVYMDKVIKTSKGYQLLVDHQFSFYKFGCTFDFAMAQSVFTHLSFSQIEQCLKELKRVMKPKGKFLFTILLSRDKEKQTLYIGDLPITKSSHVGFGFYYKMAKKYGFELTLLTGAEHPTQQVAMAVF